LSSRPGRILVVSTEAPSYKGRRHPSEIIDHCVWLYFRFTLSFRDVDELMVQRGVVVSYDTVRRWCAKFGQDYANRLRRHRARPGDKWHLDEVFAKINGTTHFRAGRHRLSAGKCRKVIADRFAAWREATSSAIAA
jgi:hypothetical protein